MTDFKFGEEYDGEKTRKYVKEVDGLLQTLKSRIAQIKPRWSVKASTQFDKTSNTTLADITGLSVPLGAGITYGFRAILDYDADATGGHKYAIAGTATATAIRYMIKSLDIATGAYVIASRHTSLGSADSEAGSTSGQSIIEGYITVNAAGTLTVQFAQDTGNNTSSILAGSNLEVWKI